MREYKACIFVDGENFRKSINTLFPKFPTRDYLPKTDWSNFFQQLCSECGNELELLRTYWYVIDQLTFYPYKVPKQGEWNHDKNKVFKQKWASKFRRKEDDIDFFEQKAKELMNEKAKMNSRFNGWRRIQEQISISSHSIEFRRSGEIAYDLYNERLTKEKAVDVMLSIDLMIFKDNFDTAIILSGDQDFVPAVRAIKNSGKKVICVFFEKKEGGALPGGARKLQEHTDSYLALPYDFLNKNLFLKK